MKTLIAVTLVLAAARAEAQTPPLSQAAKDAFYNVALCAPQGAPQDYFSNPIYQINGSRRFETSAATWKVQQAGSSYVGAVTSTMTKIATKMAGVMTFTQITSGTPTIDWRIGSSYLEPLSGQTIQLSNGCVWIPKTFAGGNKRIVATSQVVCKSASQVGENLAMHEGWWHAFMTYCDLGSGWTMHASGPGGPLYEGVPGFTELARWLQSVPAGTFPPQ